MKQESMKRALKRSNNLVCLLGRRVSMDTGCDSYSGNDFIYDVEEKYGCSPEEIFTTEFYQNRPRQFFEYYRQEILSKRGEPNECHEVLARMEKDGKLKAIVTRGIFNLAHRSGCQNVITLHGNIYDNRCPRCGKKYPMEYILNATPVPLCEECGAIVRPQICLTGEILDNQKMTESAKMIGEADTLLVLGSNLKSELCEYALKYFHGDALLLINDIPHYSDRNADYWITGHPREILPQIYP